MPPPLSEKEEEEMLARFGKGNRYAAEQNPGVLYGHRHVVEDIILAVRDGRDPEVMPADAIRAVKIVDAVYRSARAGGVKILLD